MKEQYRQGDVFLQAAAIPETAKPHETAKDAVVLAHGEVTGHRHAFYSPRVCFFRETGSDGVARSFVRVSGDTPVPLQHEEHGSIDVPPGDWEVVIQREYHPEEIRPVMD